jgi:transcription initiation factor TFIID subunit 2
LKAQRSIKSGGPPSKSPLVPTTVPLKFKVPANSNAPPTPAASAATPHPDGKKGVTFTVPAAPPKVKKPVFKKPTVKKPQFVPKAQSGGMSVQDLRACQKLLSKIKPDKHAGVFLQPVDPIRDHAPE